MIKAHTHVKVCDLLYTIWEKDGLDLPVHINCHILCGILSHIWYTHKPAGLTNDSFCVVTAATNASSLDEERLVPSFLDPPA